jgi:hypothetical protein
MYNICAIILYFRGVDAAGDFLFRLGEGNGGTISAPILITRKTQ